MAGKIFLFKLFRDGNASVGFLTRENIGVDGVDTKIEGLPRIHAAIYDSYKF